MLSQLLCSRRASAQSVHMLPLAYNKLSRLGKASAGSPSMASLGVLKPRPTFFQYRWPAFPGVFFCPTFLKLHAEARDVQTAAQIGIA